MIWRALLGLILEEATGQSYSALLEERLLGPLGMSATGLCDEDPTTTPRAQGYDATGPVDSVHMSQPYAADAICSTADDLLTWTLALHRGEVVDVDTSVDALATLPNDAPVFYTAGLFVGRNRWRDTVGHGGNIPGFTARTGWNLSRAASSCGCSDKHHDHRPRSQA